MSEKHPDYQRVLDRAITVFRDKPFSKAALAVELRIRNADLREVLDALVSDGLLTVSDGRPPMYSVKKFA